MATELRLHYPAAEAFARRHGSDAVLVLHDLVAHARMRNGCLVVEASVRDIAGRLSFLSKDTVHRRLRDLLRAKVLERQPAPSSFAVPRYVIDLSGTGIFVPRTTATRATRAR